MSGQVVVSSINIGWKSRNSFSRLPILHVQMFLEFPAIASWVPKCQRTEKQPYYNWEEVNDTSLGKDSCDGKLIWNLLSNSQSGRKTPETLTLGKQHTDTQRDCMSQYEPVHRCQFYEYKSMYPICEWQVRMVFSHSRWWLFFLRRSDLIKPFNFVALLILHSCPFLDIQEVGMQKATID